MNATPVVATTAASLTTVQVAELITWIASGCPSPMPEAISLTIAAGLIIGAHIAYRWAARRFGLPAEPETPPTPAPAPPAAG